MGWVAILTPWWGSGKPVFMVLRGACKERTKMNCRFIVTESWSGGAGSSCSTLEPPMETMSRPAAAIICVAISEALFSEKRVTGLDSRIPDKSLGY